MIQLRNVSKCYRLYRRPLHRALDAMPGLRGRFSQEFWALRDVSVRFDGGSTVGIVGPNGAGKSTLLKIVAGTTFASQGELKVEGRVAALLELGTGFHPEFSGRQNLHIGGRMLGLSEEEIVAAEPEIIAFSELGRFIDQPIRTYSSGMMMRLGFAVAACVNPDVLIVDEALSVGDAYFSQKCIRRIREFQDRGVTILFVSHDPGLVVSLCSEAYLMSGGEIHAHGDPVDVLDRYNALIAQQAAKQTARQRVRVVEGAAAAPIPRRPSSNEEIAVLEDDAPEERDAGETEREKIESSAAERLPARGARRRSGSFLGVIEGVELRNESGDPCEIVVAGRPAEIRISVAFLAPIRQPTLGIVIRDRLGLDIFGTNTHLMRTELGNFAAGERLEVRWRFENRLGPGHYTLSAALHQDRTHVESCFDWIDNMMSFEVAASPEFEHLGVVRLEPRIECDRTATNGSLREILGRLFEDAPADIVPEAGGAEGTWGLLDGWYVAEAAGDESFAWSESEAGLLLRPAGSRVVIDAAAFGRPHGGEPVALTIEDMQGTRLGDLEWPSGVRALRSFDLPPGLLEGPVILRMRVAPPLETEGRQLGLALFAAATSPNAITALMENEE